MQPSVLTLTDITFTYPDAPEPLFSGVDASFPRGWTAVVGDNGIGKSTLMAIARGALVPDEGSVAPAPKRLVIGHCPQGVDVPPERLDAFAADWSPEAIAVRDVLGVGDDWPYRYDTLSGGERKRVHLACALAARPDVLVLDEPTNHVDASARARIVDAMRAYRGIGVVVSHDAALIDTTCNRCVVFSRRHVGTRNVTVVDTVPGGWTRAAAAVAARDGADAAALAEARRETARLAASRARRLDKVRQVEAAKRDGRHVDRHDHDARDRRQLAKMTGLDRGVTRAYARLDARADAARRRAAGLTVAAKRYDGDIWMDIAPSRRRELIRLEPGVIRFDGRDVADIKPAIMRDDGMAGHAAGRDLSGLSRADVSGGRIRLSPSADGVPAMGLMIPTISIGPGDHVAVTGPNGAGKSTLLRAMLAHAADVPKLVVAQELTDDDRAAAMTRLNGLPADVRARVLGAYARLDADPDRLLAGESPSPGELRKLLVCLALPDGPQLIVMDEPTNHLDLSSRTAMARLLAEYPGALVVVSHDERFLGCCTPMVR
ncbi:ATP-binding cassette domain-containing protein [Bifidobacterium parmae]|uniref:ABC transporter n=1 Tax=Bifidobacterium parmae TaxID=361854 RepID=A0A2N5IVI6_9BIFI|nr:ATP-binding cassette domain-containing protein [Bifidobacterium parmae]PLS25983.1 ABC transporter [Bifidobacterium parmae]